MTNKDASGILKTEAISNVISEVRVALWMGANALEQEPIEDAISIQVVIEWLKAKDIIKLSSQEETARKELKALQPVLLQIELISRRYIDFLGSINA